MYNEVNGFTIFDNFFTFPVEKGTVKIEIDCSTGAVLYPENDVGQGIGCAGAGNTVIGEFNLQGNTLLILENYLSNSSISFGEIKIENKLTTTSHFIFSTDDNMKEFYTVEFGFIIFLIFLIIGKKIYFLLNR